MKLSIILTVYNKAEFLQRAFEALLSQHSVEEGDYEILVVNDGSTDNSLSIVKSYVASYSYVRLLNQNNQGLSMARNNGTEAAKGKYVWYVDADDVISPYSVRRICDAMGSSPDIIPIYAQTEGEQIIRNCIPVTVKTGKDILLYGKWQACGVFNVFRKQFLKENNLCFMPGIYHEDSEFTPRMLYAAESVAVVPEVLYTVFHEPSSITQVPRVKRAFDCLIVAERLYDFLESKVGAEPAIVRVFNNYIAGVVNGGLKVIVVNSSDEQKKFNKKLRDTPKLVSVFSKTNLLRYRIEGFLFKLFKGHYAGIYKVMKKF